MDGLCQLSQKPRPASVLRRCHTSQSSDDVGASGLFSSIGLTASPWLRNQFAPTAWNAPPGYRWSMYQFEAESEQNIAFKCGGRVTAVRLWLKQEYDSPIVPTLPLDHGCVPAHSIVS